ncbi:hypothetical protein SETIT_3G307700v2 [Setaria italica]|uniref:Uncharacterized protein n=1 Tax=Setaria italica TaxID=4555 RepID=A0A368QLA7_SETIT|nr:hypothetical protein SETIT_3G307700v2 [Setaria italica]RCV18526.1 hypothetical protein SETIT_3G307700v2 [Setaria italica]RCV18527.1 hypothetical protein SETIT_3G307700v2 [Setaria italica]RCV18528.1 hypothetical protein SETIT_3G307700v2 [Setaria italica]
MLRTQPSRRFFSHRAFPGFILLTRFSPERESRRGRSVSRSPFSARVFSPSAAAAANRHLQPPLFVGARSLPARASPPLPPPPLAICRRSRLPVLARCLRHNSPSAASFASKDSRQEPDQQDTVTAVSPAATPRRGRRCGPRPAGPATVVPPVATPRGGHQLALVRQPACCCHR